MSRLKLILPNMDYKDEIMSYKKEAMENNESMDGAIGLKKAKSFEEWYNDIYANMKEETIKKGFVIATNYLAISTENNRLIGMINIRHYLNHYLLNYGGHIGYSVRKAERYASEMLALALKECRELGIEKVLIVAEKGNIGSVKTIINNKGILENEVVEENEILQRYWITLN